MSCIPASHSMNTIFSQAESELEEGPVQRRRSRAYQIFPEANLNEESDSSSYPEDFLYRRERLPSIVVEPTDHSELESGNPHWTKQCSMSSNLEEEEEEDSSADTTDSTADGEQKQDMAIEDSSLARKSSIGLSQSQLSLSQLIPPASPTPSDSAPPCLRN